MRTPTKEQLEKLKAKYPTGTRIVIDYMDDPHAPKPGTIGTVIGVDDIGDLLMKWDNGSGLNLIPAQDDFHVASDDDFQSASDN